MKILIIKLGALGDVINTFPLIVALKKETNARIDWLVAPLSHSLVAAHTCVDHAILFDKNKLATSIPEVLDKIRQTPYDITLDLQRLFKSGLFTMASKSRRRIGFDKARCKEASWLFPFERIKPSDPEAHMLLQYMEFGAHLGIDHAPVSWKIPRQDIRYPDLPSQYGVLNIGATKAANQWHPSNFAVLAKKIEKLQYLPCVITGGPEDRAKAGVIKSEAGNAVMDLTGKTTLPELIEIIAGAQWVISCDTGPMHLAAALDTPLIALFGPSNPERTGPFKGNVILKKMHCMPCNKTQCKAPFCMEAITPEDVLGQLISR